MSVTQFHVMAKPASSTCNLDCTYCYYLSKARLPGGPGTGAIDDETLDAFIRNYIHSVTADQVVFSWQGGEPSVMGLPFFEKVIKLQRRHAQPGQRIDNDLQTNGTLLDENWAHFLKEHEFLVGISVDGPRELHDRMRVNRRGNATFERVMQGVQLLQRHGIPFNTLTCVGAHNERQPLEVYRFLRRELGTARLQFIPIVAHRDADTVAPQTWDAQAVPAIDSPRARPGQPDSVVTAWSVDPERYGDFLCAVWDEWLRVDIGKVYVNFCETLVVQHMGQPSQSCVFSPTCGTAIAMEHDGSVYACDHYVYPEYQRGNVRTDSLAEIIASPAQTGFGRAKADNLPHYCRTCDYLQDCWGECPRNRFVRTPDGEPGLNYLCPGLKRFFAHATPTATRIAGILKSQGAPA